MGTVITVAQAKGGAGKTTLLTAIAAVIAAEGVKVAIIDTDKQANAFQWAKEEFEGKGHIDHIAELSEYDLGDLIEQTRDEYDYVFIDTAGFDSVISGFAMNESDLVLIPTKATRNDAQGAINTKKTLDAHCKSTRRSVQAIGIRVDFDKGTNASDQVNELIDNNGLLEYAKTIQWHATGYKDMLNTGHPPKGRALILTNALLLELRNRKFLPSRAYPKKKAA